MSGTETTHANVDDSKIRSTQKEILLGINLDSKLKFEVHVNLCVKKPAKNFMCLPELHHS